jgi:hypothetical protein
MPRVHLDVDVSANLYQRYEEEAWREGETVEHLLEHTVRVLLHDLEEEEDRGPPESAAGMA